MSAFVYYILIYPVSFWPLKLMYVFTDFFYLLLISVLPYRRKVVRENIEKSFPDKSLKERRKIERKFYRHLCDLLAEGAKNLSISEKQLKRRFTVKNPEIVEQLHQEGKSVLLISGHYNNWEWLITGQNLLFSHQAVGIGMPLSNGFWDKKLNERRSRFGMKIIHSKIVYDFMEKNTDKIATLVLADQSPGNERKSYWLDFLHQPSGFIFGPELLANKYDFAVVYFSLHKVKRGHYQMELAEITSQPRKMAYGEITEKFAELLEKTIREEPAYWLWSHKRWKKTPPKDLAVLKIQQGQEFKRKFRNETKSAQ